MDSQAVQDGSREANANVGPAHARTLGAVNWICQHGSQTAGLCGRTLVVLPLVNILKVVDPGVIVVLPREHERIDVSRVGVRNGVACRTVSLVSRRGIPPRPEAATYCWYHISQNLLLSVPKLAAGHQGDLHMSSPPMNATVPSTRQSFSLDARLATSSMPCVLPGNLLMGPVQNVLLSSAVETLQSILRGPGEVKRLEAKVLQAGLDTLQTRDKCVAAHVVVRVPENLDVGVERFQGMLGVLWIVSAARDLIVGNLTIEFTVPCQSCPHEHTLDLYSRVRACGTSLYTITLIFTPRSAAALRSLSKR